MREKKVLTRAYNWRVMMRVEKLLSAAFLALYTLRVYVSARTCGTCAVKITIF